MAFHIVLVEPEIPANTGNISRTCAATGAWLHLVKPLGFDIDDRTLKRAGLDYWPSVKLEVHDSFAEVEEKYRGSRFFFATTKATKRYTDYQFQDGDFLVFGKETKGLSPDILAAHPDTLLRMPMDTSAVRSLNLSNSVAIMLYEALRQTGFEGLT
ncbi:tRNA (uridine(34)/cytosine(34)/5-carboxymethylaminomethyluridine(34)-2'-O)-methyltransferase TrmL [Paenibacillus chartarius]|uniref:Putative tRNA (cytidine(34)-2'-O)-methyltransferase n=1 Tax=Paenibacillus chartarius TaxID=747481 RepID=A0ABV6DK94_9BACL